MRYSPSTNGFYADEIDYQNLPDDIITISEELYQSLMKGQAEGKEISADEDGNPILKEIKIDQVAVAESMKSQLMSDASQKISILQDAVDLDMATEEEAAALLAWKKYRVLLNRVDTSNPVWPKAPKS